MVVAKSEHAYTVLKRAFKERTVDKTYHALVQGHPDPSRGTIDAPVGRHPVHDYRWAVVAGARTASPTTRRSRRSGRPRCSRSTSRPVARIRSGSTSRPFAIPASADLTYGADPTLSARLGLQRQWLHAVRLGFTHPVTRQPVIVASTYPADLAHALDVIRGSGAE